MQKIGQLIGGIMQRVDVGRNEYASFLSSSYCKHLLTLTKPAIALLVVATAIPTLLMAAGGFPDASVVLATVVGTFLAAASGAVFNQLVDEDIDVAMSRTKARPLPAASVSRNHAFVFAVLLSFFSLLILYFAASPLAAIIAHSANVFYVVVYTMFLKRRTVQNIVIGGAAGAVGPLIGWAAVTNSLSWPAWALFALIFLWTPPHFWALALKYKDDYAKAKVPMMPVVKGVWRTKLEMFIYTITLLVPVAALYHGGAAGAWFYYPSVLLTAGFIWQALSLLRSKENASPMGVFFYSCMYLYAVFGFLAVDRLLYLVSI